MPPNIRLARRRVRIISLQTIKRIIGLVIVLVASALVPLKSADVCYMAYCDAIKEEIIMTAKDRETAEAAARSHDALHHNGVKTAKVTTTSCE